MKIARKTIGFFLAFYPVVNYAQPVSADFDKAEKFRSEKQIDSAVFYYEKAAVKFKQSCKSKDFIDAYNQIGIILTRADRYDEAINYLNEALSVSLASIGENNLTVATTYLTLGVAHSAKNDFTRSLTFHAQSLAIRLRLLGGEHEDVATNYGNIGNVHFRNNDYRKAIEAHENALQIRIKKFGISAPETVQSYVNLGNAHRELKHYDGAISYFEKALRAKSLQLGENHEDLAKYYGLLSTVYYLSNNIEKGDFYKLKASKPKR